MEKTRDLVLIGDSAFAEVAYELFTHDSPYRVVAFSVERDYWKSDSLFDLPIVPLDQLARQFAPAKHEVFVAVTYAQMNRVRARLLQEVKALGYTPASYRSSRAFIWSNAVLGEHCFIFENNVIQPFARLGDNVILWSGNHIGHHSSIGDHCFISSHVVVSGFAQIHENCFLGVNSSVSNNKTVARDCWVGPGVCVAQDTQPGELYTLEKLAASRVSALRFFKVPA